MATSGDLHLATDGGSLMATDIPPVRSAAHDNIHGSCRGVDTESMLLSDEVLRAIGRVAVLAGHLELDQYFLTGALVGPDPELRDGLVRPAENFSRLQDTARRLVESRYAPHEHRYEHRLRVATARLKLPASAV